MPCYREKELEVLWNLIRAAASLGPVRELLKERGLPYSAAGDALFQDQILPALLPPAAETAPATSITEVDLIGLLRGYEGYDSHHIFLYRCDKQRATRLLDEQWVRDRLGKRARLMDCPLVLEKPAKPCLTDVWLENTEKPKTLFLKAIEKRIYQLQERPDRYTVIIRDEEERAVNFFRLHASGLLELRIQTFRYASRSYNSVQEMMWGLAGDLLQFEDFEPVNLVPLREELWKRRGKLVDQIRFRLLRLRSAIGTVMTVVTGQPDASLAADPAAVKAVNDVLRDGGYIDELNCYWLKNDVRSLPTRNAHTIFTGQVNEFVIGSCTRENYEYVLDRIAADRR